MSVSRLLVLVALLCVMYHPTSVEAEQKPDAIDAAEFVFFRFDWGIFGRVPAAEVSVRLVT